MLTFMHVTSAREAGRRPRAAAAGRHAGAGCRACSCRAGAATCYIWGLTGDAVAPKTPRRCRRRRKEVTLLPVLR